MTTMLNDKKAAARSKIVGFCETFDKPRGSSPALAEVLEQLTCIDMSLYNAFEAKMREVDFTERPNAREEIERIRNKFEQASEEITNASLELQRSYDHLQLLFFRADRIELAEAIKIFFEHD